MCTFCIQIVYSFYKYLDFFLSLWWTGNSSVLSKAQTYYQCCCILERYVHSEALKTTLSTVAVFVYSIFTIMHLHFSDIHVLVSFLLHVLPQPHSALQDSNAKHPEYGNGTHKQTSCSQCYSSQKDSSHKDRDKCTSICLHKSTVIRMFHVYRVFFLDRSFKPRRRTLRTDIQ